mmetsp:Transcript_97959/g.282575  ORF Transcript_97959/g.282575 Transcript_97959/m.282575 type:complete len:278 (-) Transcript_97959:891-1724(-)
MWQPVRQQQQQRRRRRPPSVGFVAACRAPSQRCPPTGAAGPIAPAVAFCGAARHQRRCVGDAVASHAAGGLNESKAFAHFSVFQAGSAPARVNDIKLVPGVALSLGAQCGVLVQLRGGSGGHQRGEPKRPDASQLQAHHIITSGLHSSREERKEVPRGHRIGLPDRVATGESVKRRTSRRHRRCGPTDERRRRHGSDSPVHERPLRGVAAAAAATDRRPCGGIARCMRARLEVERRGDLLGIQSRSADLGLEGLRQVVQEMLFAGPKVHIGRGAASL